MEKATTPASFEGMRSARVQQAFRDSMKRRDIEDLEALKVCAERAAVDIHARVALVLV